MKQYSSEYLTPSELQGFSTWVGGNTIPALCELQAFPSAPFGQFLPGLGQFTHKDVLTSTQLETWRNPLQISRVLSLCRSLLSGILPLWTPASFTFPDPKSIFSTHGDCQAPPRYPLPVLQPGNSAQAVSWGSRKAYLICYPPQRLLSVLPDSQCRWTTVSYLFLWLFSCFSWQCKLGPSYSILAKSRIFLFQSITARERLNDGPNIKMGK